MGDSRKEYHSQPFKDVGKILCHISMLGKGKKMEQISRNRNGSYHVEGFIDCTHENRNLLMEDIEYEETYSDPELHGSISIITFLSLSNVEKAIEK